MCHSVTHFSSEQLNQILQLVVEYPSTVRKQEKTLQLAGKFKFKEDGRNKTGYIIHKLETNL